MILIDTSVWIELLYGRAPGPDRDQILSVVTCGPVVQEVLQGLLDGPDADGFRESFLELPCLEDPVSRSLYQSAASIYRDGRRRGFTIRSSMDCLIAAIALEHEAVVWHRDRDFPIIARYTPLLQRNDSPFV